MKKNNLKGIILLLEYPKNLERFFLPKNDYQYKNEFHKLSKREAKKEKN
jgi:hypothetical protein